MVMQVASGKPLVHERNVPIKCVTHDSCGWVVDFRMKVLGMLVETLELNF